MFPLFFMSLCFIVDLRAPAGYLLEPVFCGQSKDVFPQTTAFRS